MERIVRPSSFAEKYANKPFGIYCMGGYPVIAKRTVETNHNDGNGFDFADIACIINGAPSWRKDADLLTEAEREEVIQMCENYEETKRMQFNAAMFGAY